MHDGETLQLGRCRCNFSRRPATRRKACASSSRTWTRAKSPGPCSPETLCLSAMWGAPIFRRILRRHNSLACFTTACTASCLRLLAMCRYFPRTARVPCADAISAASAAPRSANERNSITPAAHDARGFRSHAHRGLTRPPRLFRRDAEINRAGAEADGRICAVATAQSRESGRAHFGAMRPPPYCWIRVRGSILPLRTCLVRCTSRWVANMRPGRARLIGLERSIVLSPKMRRVLKNRACGLRAWASSTWQGYLGRWN